MLWFQLGIGIRNGSFVPGRDALPPTTKEMLDFLKEEGVGPLAYAYPTLAWQGSGQDEWLYESPNREVRVYVCMYTCMCGCTCVYVLKCVCVACVVCM